MTNLLLSYVYFLSHITCVHKEAASFPDWGITFTLWGFLVIVQSPWRFVVRVLWIWLSIAWCSFEIHSYLIAFHSWNIHFDFLMYWPFKCQSATNPHPRRKDRGCDKVLPDPGYWAVADQYTAMVELWLAMESVRNSVKSLLHIYLFCY
jgi:hypothetical protein